MRVFPVSHRCTADWFTFSSFATSACVSPVFNRSSLKFNGLPQVYRRLVHVQFLCNFSLRQPGFQPEFP
nr:MAG TPA: hypothetical protein [Caudoviricetes sp.]